MSHLLTAVRSYLCSCAVGVAKFVAKTGVITYSKKGMEGKPIFQCHSVERPFRKSNPYNMLLLLKLMI
jgi:hypothetical protein